MREIKEGDKITLKKEPVKKEFKHLFGKELTVGIVWGDDSITPVEDFVSIQKEDYIIKNMDKEEEIKNYLNEVITKLEAFEEDCEKIQGLWNGDESGALEDQARKYEDIKNDLYIARSKLETSIWRINNYTS